MYFFVDRTIFKIVSIAIVPLFTVALQFLYIFCLIEKCQFWRIFFHIFYRCPPFLSPFLALYLNNSISLLTHSRSWSFKYFYMPQMILFFEGVTLFLKIFILFFLVNALQTFRKYSSKINFAIPVYLCSICWAVMCWNLMFER